MNKYQQQRSEMFTEWSTHQKEWHCPNCDKELTMRQAHDAHVNNCRILCDSCELIDKLWEGTK